MLAAQLNGYPTQSYQAGFAARPDVQLNNFSYEGPAVNAQYGAAYYLAAYFLDRFGEAATQALLRHQENGITGIEATLAELGQPSPSMSWSPSGPWPTIWTAWGRAAASTSITISIYPLAQPPRTAASLPGPPAPSSNMAPTTSSYAATSLSPSSSPAPSRPNC